MGSTKIYDYGDTGYAQLRLWAEIFEDVQKFRISTENKVRAAGMDEEVIEVTLNHYRAVEKDTSALMRKIMKNVVPPNVLVWQQSQKGIGEHLLARLLGIVGDVRTAHPYHWDNWGKDSRHLVEDPPYTRKVSQLWSYCGHGDPTRKRRAKMAVEDAMGLGNPRAKMIVHLMAECCIKSSGHYREVYEKRRAYTEDNLHKATCVRCGPSGKPALEGTPWAKGHQHADALRIVGKAILKDLWIAAG